MIESHQAAPGHRRVIQRDGALDNKGLALDALHEQPPAPAGPPVTSLPGPMVLLLTSRFGTPDVSTFAIPAPAQKPVLVLMLLRTTLAFRYNWPPSFRIPPPLLVV